MHAHKVSHQLILRWCLAHSTAVSWSSDSSSHERRPTDVPPSSRLKRADAKPGNFISYLLKGPGRTLALSYPACFCEVLRSIALLASHSEVQREIIAEDLVSAYLEVSNWERGAAVMEEPANPSVKKAISRIRESLLNATYEMSALPEFWAKYGNEKEFPKLVEDCADALANVSDPGNTEATDTTIPAASACIILANLTKSPEHASFLGQQKKAHLPLSQLLRQRNDSGTLFPALALLDRLAILNENKIAMFGAGLVDDLPRFLTGFKLEPRIQREAVSLMRKLIQGHPEHIAGIGACRSGRAELVEEEETEEKEPKASGLNLSWELFQRADDPQVKAEIGRLFIEVCRTLFQSTGGHPEQVEDAIQLAFGSRIEIASPMAYLVSLDPSPEVVGEGWFGLTILSTWEHGRPSVIQALGAKEIQTKLNDALLEGDSAFRQNVSLMLTKLHLFPRHGVSESTRAFLEQAAGTAGLPPIWPVEEVVE
jgi:hypothetical protein